MIEIYSGTDIEFQISKVHQQIKQLKLDDYDFITLDGKSVDFDLTFFIMELETISLFSQPKVFLLKNFPGVSFKWPYSKDIALNVIQNILANLDWYFFFVNDADKLITSSELMKVFQKEARFHLKTNASESEMGATLNRWLDQKLPYLSSKSRGQLQQRIRSYSQLKTAIAALELADDQLSEEDILKLVQDPYEAKIYELCDNLLQKRSHQAFQIYASFKQQFIKPQSIMFQLSNQFRQYYQLFTLADGQTSYGDLAKLLKMSERQTAFILERKRHIVHPDKALYYLYRLSLFDQDIKFGRIEPDLALEKFMLEMLI